MTESTWKNVAVVEVVWTIINLAAFGVVIYLWNHVHRDRKAQRGQPERGPRDLVADANFMAESFRLLLAVLFMSAGVGAMFTPSPPPDPHFLLARAITIACLMLAAIVNVVWSMYAGAVRRRLNAYVGDIQFVKTSEPPTSDVTIAVKTDGSASTLDVSWDGGKATVTKDGGTADAEDMPDLPVRDRG